MLICKQYNMDLLISIQTNDRWNRKIAGNYKSPVVLCSPVNTFMAYGIMNTINNTISNIMNKPWKISTYFHILKKLETQSHLSLKSQQKRSLWFPANVTSVRNKSAI